MARDLITVDRGRPRKILGARSRVSGPEMDG